MDFSSSELMDRSVLSIKQDVKLLSESIVPLGGKKLQEIINRKGFKIEEIDYFLPHMSSEFFKPRIFEQLKEMGMTIPYEKWFVNLSMVGNVGAGSIYLMVDELFHSGKLKKGEKILCMVPESSRFSYVYCLMTVV
jgi:3-oxoacyl-[acyl-carrier-protein] synthase-3